MQASKLLIKRLLYNLQKHKEFPCCTSIWIIINDLLKGKQRSNPPSRYSEGEENKVSFSSLGSKHPWDKHRHKSAFTRSSLCSFLNNFPTSLRQPCCKSYHTDSRAWVLYGTEYKKKVFLLKVYYRRASRDMAHGSCFTRVELTLCPECL